MKTLLFTVALSLLSLTAFGAPEEPKPPRTLEELQESIRATLEEHRIPGAGVALVSKDEILWVSGIGKADVAAGKEATPDTLFRVGSISKSFVSLAVLMLQEWGLLSLEDKVSDLVPEIEYTNPWEKTDPVRLVHLLTHTAGFDDIHLREYAHNDPSPIRLRDALAYNPKSRTSRWRPGTHFSYCNSGPAVAAYAIETKTGRRYEEFVQENILVPLEMTTASYFLTPEVEQRLSKGYLGDGTTEVPYWHIIARPSGALNASAREMAHFVQMLLNRGSYRGKRLVSPESIDRMEKPGPTLATRAGLKIGYGLGNYTDTDSGFVFHGHDGGMDAYLASYGYLPEAGLGYVFMTNGVNGPAFDKIRKLVQGYLTRDLEKPSPSSMETPSESLRSLTGYYEPATPRAEISRFLLRIVGVIHVGAGKDNLYLDPLLGKRETILPVTDRLFRRQKEPCATMVFSDYEGRRWLLQSGASSRSISALQAWLQWILTGLAIGLMASSVGYAFFWIPRKTLGRLAATKYLHVRILPLLSVVSLMAAVGLLMASGREALFRFGGPTAWSWSFYFLTWGFAVTAVAGLVVGLRAAGRGIRKSAVVHSLLVSAACTLVTLYLAYWGLIGLKTWV